MSYSMDNGSAENNKHGVRGTEVFVGGLAPSVTETQIREILSTCGQIVEIRMIKDQNGNSKGYCFCRFSNREGAAKAVKDKAGIMLEGRKIGVRPSTEQTSLFLGNLPKEWSSDEFDRVIRQVFDDVVSVNLLMYNGVPPSQKQQNRGFGFVQFVSHAAAARAHRLGSRADFILGGKCHPAVQWAEEPEFDSEELAKVKVAFIRNLPQDVNEDFLKRLFAPHGQIEKVVVSEKGPSQAGFVHFAVRQDLERAVKQMNGRIIGGPNAGLFKLQVEVARPFEKSKKRARELSSKTASKTKSQSKFLKAEPDFPSSSPHVLKVKQDPVVADPYEAVVVSLPVAVKDCLLRILRLGIATRYDIDIHSLNTLKELPESAAISVLNQFLLSGADEIDKGAFLGQLIRKYLVRSLGNRQVPGYASRENGTLSIRTDLARLSDRSQVLAVDSLPSQVASTASRHDPYSPRFSSLDYPLPPRASIPRIVDERNPSPLHFLGSSPGSVRRGGVTSSPLKLGPPPLPFSGSPPTYGTRLVSGSPPSYGRRLVDSPSVVVGSSLQSKRSQVRFDPFTGEPYKFDPFTGEIIRPDSVSRSGGSLY